MSKHNITVTGVTGGRVERSNVAGIVHGGMGNTLTTTHNQENRQQTYNIENAQGVVGGQDMRGASVNQGGLTGGRSGHSAHFEGKELADITEEDIVGLLREKKLAKHIQLFQEKGIDGDLLSQLTDGDLIDFGIDESFERKKILNLKKCLPK
ncbi:ankyrin repeat and SAM domain-containing protein 6-like [Haliotis asinina]|uniref:ankyrin repeat and SAM domain-containing protein 6-like n=1 Tax=Haliotis asinina TaxID=109174 RepID=UPI0035320951